jgi:hypothetical protein
MRRLPTLIGLSLALAAPFARGCPMAGDTLWNLVAESDAIALVVPASVHGRPDLFDVIELWKGSAPATVELPWLAGACSSDEAASPMLVFLLQASRRVERANADEDPPPAARRELLLERWEPVRPQALPACPSLEELDVLQERIDEAQRVQASGDPAGRRRYLVENLALRVTRSDAAIDLFQTDERERQPATPSEQALVARGFLDEPAGDDGLPGVLQFLEGYADPLFERAALRAAESALAAEEPDYWVLGALSRLLARHAPGASLDDFLPPEPDQDSSAWGPKLRQAWALAREHYGMPRGD